MNCPNDGQLRAFLDGELDPEILNRTRQHMDSCSACRARVASLQSRAAEIANLLSPVSAPHQASPNPELAYARLSERIEAPALARRSFAAIPRRVWAAAAAMGLIAILLSTPPARIWAQKVLDMLRVQKVAVVPIDMSAFGRSAPNASAQKLLTQMISDSVIVTMKPGPPELASNIGAASQLAGMTVRSPSALSVPQKIFVNGELAFHMTLDRDRIVDVLDQAGRSDVQVPSSVDGSTIAVHVPKMVRLEYGTCPTPSAPGCLSLMEVPSPVISVPPALDITALAQAGLQIAGMSATEARAFCQTVDWSSTLVIPVPLNASSYTTTSVDGVNGTLIQIVPRGGAAPRYSLIWVKNGIVYSINGAGSGEQAVSVAESLN